MASSSSATISKARRYDVFLSFRGEDTRNGFTSHLHEALSSSQISTFIDNNLRRGDNISPSLLTAIEESMISVIIFSEDYANSRWCLKELIKIFQCKHLNGQIVIPVFYGVDPSHVRKQIGKFGVAFDKLKERLREGGMDMDDVRSHLEEAANISGWNSHYISPESELIKSIVGDILKKLNQMALNLPSNLVGIGSHIERVEALLCLESPQFRIVGLWGMGGIGKTTVAQTVYHRICSTFDGFYFVEKVSEKLKNQSVGDDLREKIVLKLFEEESLNMGSRTLHHDFIMKQLQRKKVLIVLDDVDDAIEAQKLLAGENDHLFSGGSRILVTSRDKQVLKNIVGDQNQIYEVEGLNEEDGLQLFSLRAFKQNHPTSDRLGLSRRVLIYARGNPLALDVLGHALFDKSKEEWVSALNELGEEPFPDIQKVLRISYDALCDEEKMIFLDIASFLVGKTLDFVVAYYKGYVKRIEYKISNLVDKSLITISEDKELEMHDLLKEMGRSFESAKGLEERTRIWFLKDVVRVSKKRKEISTIETINVNLCQGERTLELDCNVFARLDGLKFLEFYNDYAAEESKVRFCWERFRGFPEELRYFRWDAYPQNSLPSNFCIENLVELHMPNTAIIKLWTGKQNIVNLKIINLERANKLVEFPDVSEGRNIQEINLDWCKNLVKLPPSIQHLPKLKILNLDLCSTVESIPTTFDSKVLEVLDLRHCECVKMFPQVASQGNIIRELILDGTDIREVPSSVELLKGLEYLSMWGCKKLSIISTNICKLKSLKLLNLHGCPNLESFPEIMELMESLTRLYLGGCTRLKRLPNDHSFHNLKSLALLRLDDTAITELPSSIQHLICLKELSVSGCQNLTSLPSSIHNLRNLTTINASGSGIVNLPESICQLFEMKYLDLSRCKCLRSLPASMKQLSQLLYLDVAGCSNLCSLPELPSSLEALDADGCVSLKTISSVELLKGLESLSMSGCEKLSIISTDICKLKSLSKLYLSDCTNLESFPEIMEPMDSLTRLYLGGCTRLKRLPNDHSFHNLKSLEELHLDDTAITELPSSIQHLICLKTLSMSGCQNLTSLPSSIHNLRNLTRIYARDSGIVDLPESICQLFEMEYLDLSGCKCLRSLPASMKQLSQLLYLSLEGCSNLCSLPGLPSSLKTLNANGCVSLKTISSACLSGNRTTILKFASCFESEEEERRRVLDIGFSKLHYILDRQGILNSKKFEMILPWSTEIPQWFCGSQSVGSSLTLKLPMDDRYYRFAFCVVIKPNYANSINAEDYSGYSKNYLECYVDDDGYGLPVTSCELDHLSSDIEHLSLWHHPRDDELRKYFGREVSLQFRDIKGEVEITRCGVVIFCV